MSCQQRNFDRRVEKINSLSIPLIQAVDIAAFHCRPKLKFYSFLIQFRKTIVCSLMKINREQKLINDTLEHKMPMI